MARPTKYKKEMCKKAYEELKDGGTLLHVCHVLGISKETLLQWAGKGKYKDSPYIKPEFSDYIKKGELAGQVWLEDEIRKAATEECKGNPTMLIFMTKRRDFIPRLIPELKNGTTMQKLNAITDLYCDGIICLDTYEQALTVLDRQLGVIEKAKYEEFGKQLEEVHAEIRRLKEANSAREAMQNSFN